MGSETALKVGLYFRDLYAYHFPTNQDRSLLKVETGPLGRYYADQAFHVQRGHWPDLDGDGLPWRRHSEGVFMHRHETLSSWAFGQWDLYLLSGDEGFLENLVKACDYHIATADRSDPSCVVLRDEEPRRGHVGPSSGLTHGQAIGMLARAYQVTHRDDYLKLAVELLDYLERPAELGGARGRIPATNGTWFEEDRRIPLRHILNGMIITMWGVHDLDEVADVPRARRLWEDGVDSLERALPLYDAGYWSWYYIADAEPPYIASAKYHGCHVAYLEIMHALTGVRTFEEYATRFRAQGARALSRSRAAAAMVRARVAGQTRRD